MEFVNVEEISPSYLAIAFSVVPIPACPWTTFHKGLLCSLKRRHQGHFRSDMEKRDFKLREPAKAEKEQQTAF